MTAETGSDDALSLEFMDFMKIPEISEGTLDEPSTVNANVCVLSRPKNEQASHNRVIHGESSMFNGDRIKGPLTARQRLQTWGFRNDQKPVAARSDMSRVAAAGFETPVKTPGPSDPLPSLPDGTRMNENVAHA